MSDDDRDKKNTIDQTSSDNSLPSWAIALIIVGGCLFMAYVGYKVFVEDTTYPQIEYSD